MNKQMKNYIRYYLRDNKRLLFLVFIILFMMIPFLAFNVSVLSNDVSYDGAFSIMAAASCIGGCALSFLVPIFNMRFLFMKRSCDLYFSLPITRKDLFHMQYISGILAILLPLSINYLLGSIVVVISSQLGSGIGSYISYLLFAILLFYVVLVIFIVVLYSIFTFISTICNNLIDNIFIAGCAVVLPYILYYTLQFFISNQIGQALGGITYNTYNEFYDMHIIWQVLSPPSVLYIALYNIVVELFMVETLNFMSFTYLMIYWVVVGGLAYIFAKKYFIARKQEAAEQRTTHILTYPLIIVIVTWSILLMVMAGSMGVIIPTIMAFMAYSCMIFFSKRVIKLKLGDIIAFIVIFAVSASFSFAFNKTNGFGTIKEFPVVDNIKVAYIDVYGFNDDDEYLLIDRQIGQKGKIAKVISYHYEAGKKKDFERFIENQKYASSNRLGAYEPDDTYSMQIQYELKDGRTLIRNYNLASTKENKKKLEELLITMIDEGKNVNIGFEEE